MNASSFLPICSSAKIRELELAAQAAQAAQGAQSATTTASLMELAGLAAAEYAQTLLGEPACSPGRSVLVVAGPGNNGGDAFEAAVHLKRNFFRVSVVFSGDPARLPADARKAINKWIAIGGAWTEDIPQPSPRACDLVFDGLFGIGLSRPLEGRHAALVTEMNNLGVPILALDVPSGINSDTGAVMGIAVRATHTLTFLARKPGLLTLDGPDHCGALRCATLGLDLGLDSATKNSATPNPATLLEQQGGLLDDSVLDALPRRPANFHKGLAGMVGVIGGADGMLGAVLLAGRAALKTGAGKVFAGFLCAHPPRVDAIQPELMLRAPAACMADSDVVLLGPGMGTSPAATALLRTALALDKSLVLDADALNLLAADTSLHTLVRSRTAATLMTPHPAEAARLLGMTTAEVQRDRVAAAKTLAARYASLVLVKGNGSVLADPAGAWWINPTGNPGMASAGMGDALSGMLAALLAQRMAPAAALRLAVWAHGAAADALCADGRGPLGITASEVIEQARLIFNRRRSRSSA